MTRKADRFTRMVTNELTLIQYDTMKLPEPHTTMIEMNDEVSVRRIVKLLRREHEAVVRMVKKEFSKMLAITQDRTNSNGRIVMAHYKALQCRDLLEQLERRGR